MANASSETVVTLDLRDIDQQQLQSTSLPEQPGKSNTRPLSAIAEAVKLFSSKAKLAEGRMPFFALAKSSKVSLQPWPSATNLRSEPVAGSDWSKDNSESEPGSRTRLSQSRSFNIPSIDVRQSSIDDDFGDDDDDDVGGLSKSAGMIKKRSSQ